jgi:diguanylate cyclase (GGDEF)-like protein
MVARFGGDEFAILMPVGTAMEATELADLLTAAVERDVSSPAGPVSASVGIALVGKHSTPDELLSQADRAMYATKRATKTTATRPDRHLRPVE